MAKFLKSGLGLFILGLLFSCSEGEKQPLSNPTQIDVYFPIKDFVEEQISLLDQKKVKKSVLINSVKKETFTTFDINQWRKELDVFIKADINKASLASAYRIEKNKDKTTYQLKPGEKASIQEIVLAYEGERIKSLYFVSSKENLFYNSKSEGSLIVDENSGLLHSYHVKGSQKVWFLPANNMEVEAEIFI